MSKSKLYVKNAPDFPQRQKKQLVDKNGKETRKNPEKSSNI